MYKKVADKWIESDFISEEFKAIIKAMDEKELEECFYKNLEFGTGGLRGKMGVGSNRMNYVTIGKATQGLANYLLDKYEGSNIIINIAYDSRNNSKYFSEVVAGVLCGNGIEVNLFDDLRPTPELSFSIPVCGAKGGIVITASHNPKEYNGYKVYNEYGGQITDDAAREIIDSVNKVENFEEIKRISLEEAKEKGLLNIIGENIDKLYMEKVKQLIIRRDMINENADKIKIVYTPIHGSGNVPVRRVLDELGFKNVVVVEEQEKPNGDFPTVPYPNPEDSRAFELALNLARRFESDIVIGTDPDCDRIGVLCKDGDEYFVFNGNMIGILISDYLLSSMKEKCIMPENGEIIKTIVTTDMIKRIAEDYGCSISDVLTGFKYIGEKIYGFEKSGEKKFIFGLEESFGYLSGAFVKDKDAVIASALICEMALYYKLKNQSLKDRLFELYEKYGYFKEDLISITLEGKEGAEKIAVAMDRLRNMSNIDFNDFNIKEIQDYNKSQCLICEEKKIEKINLPKSNVLKFIFTDDSWFVVRPSGTEPKIKIYLSTNGKDKEELNEKRESLKTQVENLIDIILK
ncbi:phospho-sugar mutase [Oceanirhabdus sp. W0125-5]|uniref:phospho-sugar mutase n=1 Tax=Oceanirhabdus sp. W0125-5 TaxID=2999116 RepID=UPI0022F327D6|nr:phospho-sugar mutase [Oceanirhabdus sp. W0125-5]WBW99429.1 phospho-sugar mutase [Oceanirhabdus sp. W0125-5]